MQTTGTRIEEREQKLGRDQWNKVEDFVTFDNLNGQNLSQILKQVKGNYLKTKKLLKISRSKLYTKIEEYQIG